MSYRSIEYYCAIGYQSIYFLLPGKTDTLFKKEVKKNVQVVHTKLLTTVV